MKDIPAGIPASVPIGMVICGKPLIPAMQVRRITRTRNSSRSDAVEFFNGAMYGALQPLSDQSRQDVAAVAGRETYEQAHRSRRIALRPRDPQQAR